MKKCYLSKNVLQDITNVVTQTIREAKNDNTQYVKLKDKTVKILVDFGIKNLPMLERVSHVRENILTVKDAKKLGFSIKNKHFHGLGVKRYLEIINAMEKPYKIYQYIEESNRFIIKTSIEINKVKSIVPIKVEQKGIYNNVEIDFNKVRTIFSPDSSNYLLNLVNKGIIKEIFAGDNSQKTSLSINNIQQNISTVNKEVKDDNKRY